jgi:hypothetical protein
MQNAEFRIQNLASAFVPSAFRRATFGEEDSPPSIHTEHSPFRHSAIRHSGDSEF